MACVGADQGHTEFGSSVQVVRPGLGHSHVIATQLGEYRAHDPPLLLQRRDVPEQDVEPQGADDQVRAFSLISKVSITSSTLMSLNDPSPIPHS